MTSFAVVNLLQDVEDFAEGKVEGYDARFGRQHIESRDLGVSLFRYAAGVRSPIPHSHREQEEAYVVVEGSGRVLLDGEVRDLRQWDLVRVSPEVVRAFEGGPEELYVVAVGGPKPEGGDGVRSDTGWPDD